MDLHLDYAEIERILKEEMRGPVDEVAARVAANVDVGSVTEAEVKVSHYTTDRALAVVMIAHPAGMAMQAKHGTLTRAAAVAGLEVVSR